VTPSNGLLDEASVVQICVHVVRHRMAFAEVTGKSRGERRRLFLSQVFIERCAQSPILASTAIPSAFVPAS
jgi:hypothetical protein